MRLSARGGIALAGILLVGIPFLKLPAFYESFLYLVFHWIVLATSWNILSGYSGYFSFGHGAFFGAGMYTTATLAGQFDMPFLWTLPVAALVAALFGMGIGAVVFRVGRLRGELFALLTLAVTFVLATIVLNTPLDGGQGVNLGGVRLPAIMPTPSSTFYLLALILALATIAIAYEIYHARLGTGLFAIHDDEDVAEVMGVPTFRYKIVALGVSCALAGIAGGIHAMFVSYVTVGETFSIIVPLTVVLMSVLGATRHWLGPAVGATVITALLYAFTAGDYAIAGRAAVGVILIVVILFLPNGLLGRFVRSAQGRGRATVGGRGADRDACGRRSAVSAAAIGRAGGRDAARGARPVEVVQGIAGARRRRPRRAARRDPRPGRPQRIGQVDADQRGERALPLRRGKHRLRRAAISPARKPIASRAPASRAPTRSRGRSRTCPSCRTSRFPRGSAATRSIASPPSARPATGSSSPGSRPRRTTCPTISTCTSASSSSSRARSRHARSSCSSTRCCRDSRLRRSTARSARSARSGIAARRSSSSST